MPNLGASVECLWSLNWHPTDLVGLEEHTAHEFVMRIALSTSRPEQMKELTYTNAQRISEGVTDIGAIFGTCHESGQP